MAPLSMNQVDIMTTSNKNTIDENTEVECNLNAEEQEILLDQVVGGIWPTVPIEHIIADKNHH
jgi:hypothetical protein